MKPGKVKKRSAEECSRSSAIKEYATLFAGTGLDPRPEFRKKVAMKAKELNKRRKKKHKGRSSDSEKKDPPPSSPRPSPLSSTNHW